MSDWIIYNIPDDTQEEIKKQAKQRGLTIGKYLEFVFNEEIFVNPMPDYSNKNERAKQVKIWLKPSSKKKLEQKALENGFNLSKYLEYLAYNS